MSMQYTAHYVNMSMQYTEIFQVVKIEILIFFLFLRKIDCGYTLEPPRRGNSNEYPQSMFWSKNKTRTPRRSISHLHRAKSIDREI